MDICIDRKKKNAELRELLALVLV